MVTRIKISTSGFSEYLEKLAAAGKNIDLNIQKALMAGAEVAKAGMVKRVPKDTHNLEKHIEIDGPHQNGNFSSVSVGLTAPDKETARYGNSQEYGTSSMPAQPYIRPTMKSDARKIRAAIKESLVEDGML